MALSNDSSRHLNHLKVGGQPIKTWSQVVFLYRHGKISEAQAEDIRSRLAGHIKAAAKGFSDDDHQSYFEATGQVVPAAENQIAENLSKIAQLEAMLAAL